MLKMTHLMMFCGVTKAVFKWTGIENYRFEPPKLKGKPKRPYKVLVLG